MLVPDEGQLQAGLGNLVCLLRKELCESLPVEKNAQINCH